jgi:hypothetical protein
MKKTKYCILMILFITLIFISIVNIGESHIENNISDSYENEVDEIELYLEHIGNRESGGNYLIVNSYGYMGKYQFSPKTLRGLGINVNRKDFLSNPILQDSAMVVLLIHNKELLETYINLYDGSYMDGNLITESGILAAAHLIGPKRTKILLKDGIDSYDGYGTPVSSYIKEFSGYSLNLQ